MLTSGFSARVVARIAAASLVLALCSGVAMAADPAKVLRYVFPAGEEGFDPQAAHDLYSGTVEQAIFETLLTYDYLARPVKLVPGTAEAMEPKAPRISTGASGLGSQVSSWLCPPLA